MPFYDLRCPACDKEFNISASIKDKTENKIPCPECGGFGLETVFKAAPGYVKGKVPDCPNRTAACGGCRHAG